jgi:hypothetical protein
MPRRDDSGDVLAASLVPAEATPSARQPSVIVTRLIAHVDFCAGRESVTLASHVEARRLLESSTHSGTRFGMAHNPSAADKFVAKRHLGCECRNRNMHSPSGTLLCNWVRTSVLGRSAVASRHERALFLC